MGKIEGRNTPAKQGILLLRFRYDEHEHIDDGGALLGPEVVDVWLKQGGQELLELEGGDGCFLGASPRVVSGCGKY